jgi:WD40 repeat protein
MSPDAQTLVTVGWRDDLAWWDLNDPEEPIMRISGSHAVFSEDGGTLVTVTREGYSIIWDVESRKERVRIDHGGQSFGSSAALSPDGRILAMTYGFDDFENAVSLWDTSSGKHLGTLAGHKQAIWSVAFTPDGKTLATSSSDGTLRLWNVKSRRELLSIEEPGTNLSNLRFSPDGNFLVGGAPLFASPGELRIIHAPPITFDETKRELIP